VIFTVAIDGPAAAGKGTISKAVAAHFGFAHLDSGLLYRAVGRRALQGEDPVEAARDLQAEDLENYDLRTAEIAAAASRAAAIAKVRQELIDFQQTFARREDGAVIDGRDIGTVICPEAEVKFFVTASDAVRAERRFLELSAKGAETTNAAVLADLRARDALDAGREASPMRAAADAILLDTSELSIEQAVNRAISVVAEKLQPLI
jgi:cytidylate kinase